MQTLQTHPLSNPLIQPGMTTLHAATSNQGKLREFATAAAPAGFAVLPLPDLDTLTAPAEDAATFTGNADLKAAAYSLHAPGSLVFADDSGLEIDALGGRPGVLSARFAETLHFLPERHLPTDERNNRCILALLQELISTGRPLARRARFVCALSLARDGEVLLRAEGTVEGEILDTPRGSNGFGYDPLFLIPSRGLTLAELPPADKWALSHRGNAFRALLQTLAQQPQRNP